MGKQLRWCMMIIIVALIFLGIGCPAKSVKAATIVSSITENGIKKYVINTTGEDDDKIIQKCLASNGDNGVQITLQPGTYHIRYSLKVFNNAKIIATGATFIQETNGKGFLINARFEGSNYGNDKGGYNSCENITIDGGTWIGTYKPDVSKDKKSNGFYVGYCSMMFLHGQNITIQNASFKHNYNGHFIELGGIKNGKIINCNMDMAGSVYVGESNNEAIQIDNTYAKSNSPVGAPWDDTACQDITVQKCRIRYVRGVGTNLVGNTPYINIKILDNTIFATKNVGINAYDIKGLSVTNNTVQVLHKSNDYTSVGLYVGLNTKMSNWGNYSTLITGNKITGYSNAVKVVGFNGATFNKVTIQNNTLLAGAGAKAALFLAYGGKQIVKLVSGNNICKTAVFK